MGENARHNPTINIQQPTLLPSKSSPKMTRTPSHESILESRISSGLKVSFRGDQHLSHRGPTVPNIRIPSPLPNEHLLLSIPPPSASRQNDVFDDECDMIKSCAVLAKALGLQKSFSTSDILNLKLNNNPTCPSSKDKENPGDFFSSITKSFSEMHLMDAIPLGKLEASSRSLSTWVAVGGDKSATSQLPSPQTRHGSTNPAFTPADLIRSVNKKIRQNYMRKRLLSTYRALERMSQSGFNLEKIKLPKKDDKLSSPSANASSYNEGNIVEKTKTAISISDPPSKGNKSIVSRNEVARNRGKPLTKFERNIIIFDWLHTLDAESTPESN